MTQCPYKHELYKNEEENITAGIYGNRLISYGPVCACCQVDYITNIANKVGLEDLDQYNVLQEETGNIAVTLGNTKITEEEMIKTLHKLYDQELACANCQLSRSMDRWHGQPERVVEKVELGENQIIAYGAVVDLMPYEKAREHIAWYLEKTGKEGCAMLADIGYSGYEIVLHHVKIGDTHYAGDDDYVSPADAQRLVDEGLAEYMEMDYT